MLAIGIDIGGTNTKLGFVTQQGDCLVQDVFKTSGFDSGMDYTSELILKIENLLNRRPDLSIVGIGIGAPGADIKSGSLRHAKNINWDTSYPIINRLRHHFNTAVKLTSDASAAALGEAKFGAARQVENFLMITLGTGLGSAIFCNGRLLFGTNGMAAEIGHLVVEKNGRKCQCGKYGCIETYVSATGICRTVSEELRRSGRPSILRSLPIEVLDAKAIAEAAAMGDSIASSAFEHLGLILGTKLAEMVTIFDPELIVISGGLAQSTHLFFDTLNTSMKSGLLNIYDQKVKVVKSQLNGSSGAILGAASTMF